MISDSEIPKCPEFEVRTKIGKLFMNEKILEEYSVKVYEIDPYFYEHHKEKIKVDKNECEYIFKIDFYFTEYFQQQKLINNTMNVENLFLKKKRQEALEKSLIVNLLDLIQVMQKEVMTQTMKLVKYKYLSVNLNKKIKKKKTK